MPAVDQPGLMPMGGVRPGMAGEEVARTKPLDLGQVGEAHLVGRLLAAVRRAQDEQRVHVDGAAGTDEVLVEVEVEGTVDDLADLLDVPEAAQVAQVELDRQRCRVPVEGDAHLRLRAGAVLDADEELVVA